MGPESRRRVFFARMGRKCSIPLVKGANQLNEGRGKKKRRIEGTGDEFEKIPKGPRRGVTTKACRELIPKAGEKMVKERKN